MNMRTQRYQEKGAKGTKTQISSGAGFAASGSCFFDLIIDQPRAVIKNGDGKIREREKVKKGTREFDRESTDFSAVR
jgi:hypothetical protein